MRLLAKGASAQGIHLDKIQMEQFRRYYQELVDWNERVNLTAITDWNQVQTRHFVDSLTVSTVLPPELLGSGARVLDLGSGAGFPGLPLKIAFQRVEMTLLDSRRKRTAFLAHISRVLELTDVEVLTGRAETLAHEPALRESYDAVVTRAVARMSVLAELALPFCRTGGLVVAQKAPGVEQEMREAHMAINTVGGAITQVKEVTYEGLDGAMVLVVLTKTTLTPSRYPRRPGILAKRPL